MSTACEAVGLVRDDGLDDSAGEHVALGKAELQGRVNGKAIGMRLMYFVRTYTEVKLVLEMAVGSL